MNRLFITLLLLLSSLFASAQDSAKETTTFAWGAELGAAIDIGGHDMSDINLNAYFGLKNKYFHLLGVGAGIDMVMANSSRYFPVYGVLRTTFGHPTSRIFVDLRGGVAFNSIANEGTSCRTYVNPGIGCYLATGASYRSYLILSYVYNDLHYSGAHPDIDRINGLNYAKIAIGITF